MKDLKIFAKTIEPQAQAQIDLLLAQKPFEDCKVRIMPDVHAGAGCVIGFTANLGDKVIPNIVGVDIGCGMLTVNLGPIEIDYAKLDDVIRKYIPSGMAVHQNAGYFTLLDDLYCRDRLRNVEWLHNSIGTLGGGNHFIEIDAGEDGNKYLIIHTGSRNLGKQVAEIYQDIAVKTLHSAKGERAALIERLKAEGRESEISEKLSRLKVKSTIPRDLCYVEGEDRERYLHDMRICQQFARFNRSRISQAIMQRMGWLPFDRFETVHNYIDEWGMVRKGAICAAAGKIVLIPINMKDGCIIGRGLGNSDWNESAPHGAGRLMSRAKAKASIPMEDYRAAMEGIYTTSVCRNTLDEAPQAYKPMGEILSCISDTVTVLQIIKPVYNFKAGFKAKLEGADQWVYVGDDWINHTSNTAAMIKEVCGSYPSEWNGKRCADMYPVLMQGASLLCLHPKRYRQFEPGNCWGTVESTAEFLRQIADNCDKFPTAVIEVDC